MKKNSYRLEVITPERVIIDQEVVFSVVHSGRGPVGILPGHAPLLGTVLTGVLKLRDTEKKELFAFIRSGFFMVSHEGITIVARSAEISSRIDVQRAMAARDRAQQILATCSAGMDIERARDALLRAECRIKIAQGAVQ